MTETLEHTARQIAERGRDQLVARLRPAFEEAASAHADVLELDDDQVEQMVQRAADRADGLQWRRALASVASEQLGIGMGEALAHPAVARAQAIVGAPSYEESLAKLKQAAQTAAAGAAAAATAPEPGVEQEQERVAEPEATVEADAIELEELDEDFEDEPEPEEEEFEDEDEADDESHDDEAMLRLAAVHLGGIANLSAGEQGIELRLSREGLDIARGGNDVLGRLAWDDIHALEVPPPRGLRRKRRGETHLVVRTAHGDASFEVPAITPEELRQHVEPAIERYKRA